MKIQQIRNATIIVEYAGVRFLVDPMLCAKGLFGPFPFSHHQEQRNPLHDLPMRAEQVISGIDSVLTFKRITVSWSVNTLDEQFKDAMDDAPSIERRLAAMKKVYESGIRTVCFVSPIFPCITDVFAIIERVKDYTDLIWLENLNLRGQFKPTIMQYIRDEHPDLLPLYDDIYRRKRRDYWQTLAQQVETYAKDHGIPYVINDLPYGRSEHGHPVVVNYFYHEEIRQKR